MNPGEHSGSDSGSVSEGSHPSPAAPLKSPYLRGFSIGLLPWTRLDTSVRQIVGDQQLPHRIAEHVGMFVGKALRGELWEHAPGGTVIVRDSK